MRDSNRQFTMRLITAVFVALVFSNAAISAEPVNFAPSIRVTLYAPATEQWILTTAAEAKPGSEFVYNNQLYHVVETGKAQLISSVEIAKLIDADLPYDPAKHRDPKAGDVVQILDKDMAFASHATFSSVAPDAKIRFQGKAYGIDKNKSLVDTEKTFAPATNTLQHIEPTRSSMQHITDRHTAGGSKNAGASTFNPGENIQALIKSAEFFSRTLESNGYYKREFDFGRNIGYQGSKKASLLRVITAQSGALVTAYPVVQQAWSNYGY